MPRRRRLPGLPVVALVAAIACSLLVATTAGAKPRKSSEVTLRIMTNTSWAIPLGIMISNFNRVYPDIKISPEIVPAPQQAALYQTQFRSGNAPDILQLLPGRGNPLGVLNYSDAGYLVDLAGRPWEKRLAQPQLVGAKQGKKLWDASMGVSIIGHAYNIDLFKQLGVKVPTTWAQLLDGCKKFTAAGKTMFIYQGGDAQNGNTYPITQAGSVVNGPNPNFNVDRQSGKISFANSKWRRVLEQVVEARNAGCFSPGTVGVTQQTAIAQFAKGEGGIIPQQSGGLGSILALNPPFKIGYLAGIPDKASEARVAFQPSWAVGVNAQISADKKEAALKFIDFMQRPKQTETFDKAAGLLLSGYVLKTGKFPTWAQPYLEIVGPLIKSGKFSIQQSAVWPNASVYNALYQGMVGLFTGQKTVDQILADMDAAFNRGVGG